LRNPVQQLAWRSTWLQLAPAFYMASISTCLLHGFICNIK